MDPLSCWAVVALATVAACYLSLALGAVRSYSWAKFEAVLEHDPKRLRGVRALLDDEERLALTLAALRAVLLVAGLVGLTGAVVGHTVGAAPAGGVGPWGWLLAGLEAGLLGVALFVVVGQVLPYAVGEARAEAVLLYWLRSLRLLSRLTAPLGWALGGLVKATLRVANVREVEKEEEIKDEILSAALAGESQGLIDEHAMDVIENLMEFRDVAVTEVMTPRIDIDSVDVADDVETMLRKAIAVGRSRLPVTDGSLDKLVGVLLVKDLLKAIEDPSLDPRSLYRRPLFVPESKRVADLLKELRAKNFHMAIVADEYGGTAGLVTIEDLIEELIGEIEDEHDKVDVPVRRISAREVDVDAKLHIDEANEELGTKIPEDEDVETIGGFIALRLGRIPRRGDAVVLNGTSFTVTEADERRVSRVLIKLAK